MWWMMSVCPSVSGILSETITKTGVLLMAGEILEKLNRLCLAQSGLKYLLPASIQV